MHEEEPRPPSIGLRVMAGFVILFVLIAVVVLPATMGTWDPLATGIAFAGLAAVGIWAYFGLRWTRDRDSDDPPPEE